MQIMEYRLDGKVALITGAGRGIGLGMAKALAEHGCSVAIQDIDFEVAKEEAERICKAGGRAIALPGDATDLSWPAKWISRTIEQLGGLHILINNAAIQIEKHWLQQTTEEIHRQFTANLTTPILLCQQVAPIFRQQKWGRIINLGSIQQRHGNPGMLPYAMSKSALENMTRALAQDLADANVTVNLLAPGFFKTHRTRKFWESGRANLADALNWVPLKRAGDPADIVPITLLLCSDQGSFITGQTIFVDGGLSIK